MQPSAASSAPGTAPARPAPPPPEDLRPPRRRVRNYLLDTGLQLRLASYLVAVATVLSLGLGWLLWSAYRETSRVVALGAPDAGESIAAALAAEDRARIAFVAIVLAAVLVCLLGAAVVVTHRIAGPAYVLRNACGRIADGDLSRPRPLRSHDLLVDLADGVSGMVDALRAREEADREVVARAAAVLRDPRSSADARAAAAAELERVAAEKEARLAS
jgi:methyl-accepting chemotaxis protein